MSVEMWRQYRGGNSRRFFDVCKSSDGDAGNTVAAIRDVSLMYVSRRTGTLLTARGRERGREEGGGGGATARRDL